MVDIETDLIDKCKKGDLNSFEVLINTYSSIVYNILFRILGNEEDAKDVSQEVFIKVYKKLSTFKGQSKFSTWLYRITVNSAKDFIKKRKDVVMVDNYEAIEREFTPTNDYHKKDDSMMINQGLRRLKDELREIIVLKDIQGFSYEEISGILDINIGTVKSRLNRARLKLREHLLDLADSY